MVQRVRLGIWFAWTPSVPTLDFIKALCDSLYLLMFQVTYLEESLEEMRQKLASEREELLRERSRCAMARLEADAQEKAWAARKAETDEEAREERDYSL